MATKQAANVVKYEAGGTGDNIISDGYIKTVEKIWLDQYALTSAAIAAGDELEVAIIPANKKITNIRVTFPVLTASATLGSVSIGYKRNDLTTNATLFLAATSLTTSLLKLEADAGMGTIMSAGTNKIYLHFTTTGTTITVGTITTVVRYT
jgi:hypothetical protein